jgi:hypothetical protein
VLFPQLRQPVLELLELAGRGRVRPVSELAPELPPALAQRVDLPMDLLVRVHIGKNAGLPGLYSRASLTRGSSGRTLLSPTSEGEKEGTMKARMIVAVAALAVAGLAASTAHAQPTVLQGELAGAPYEIVVPEAWNGTLIVVAHGYVDKADHPGEVDDRDPLDAGLAGLLAAQGYAVAGTAYRDNGWAVKESIHDLRALRAFFNGAVGQPDTSLLLGFSLGTLATATLAEGAGELFDGYLPACGVLAGAPAAWDAAAAGLLAYSVVFGGVPSAWGTLADGDDDVDFESEVVPVILPQLVNPLNFGKWEFVRLIAGARGPSVPLPPSLYPDWAFTDFFFFTEARGELERRAGGPYVRTIGHYTLSLTELAYLAALGFDANSALNAMNAAPEVAPDPSARNYVEHYASFTGKIKSPVLSIHTTWDTLVPVSHEQRYATTVAAAGRGDLLRQGYSSGIGHCAFGPELFGAISLLESWAKTGVAPSAAALAAVGLDPAFVPPPWPQP